MQSNPTPEVFGQGGGGIEGWVRGGASMEHGTRAGCTVWGQGGLEWEMGARCPSRQLLHVRLG